MKPLTKVTLEDLQEAPKISGILTDSRLITIKFPLIWVYTPVPGEGITTTSTNNPALAAAILSATHTMVLDVKKKYGTLQFTVAEPYLRVFLTDLSRIEGAELIIGD